ncbi:MAG TPA: transposase [Marmoricola sp.]|nr:transposase [Marmoricola sp.]
MDRHEPGIVAVLTVDQRGSRTGTDRVPELLAALDGPGLERPLRRFERTAGDEVQGICATAVALTQRLALLIREGGWNVGVGLGPVEQPLPRSTRAGRGDAFVLAREAVTRAKLVPAHLSVVGADPYRAEQLETVLWLWAGVLSRRSRRGWEVVELLDAGLSHTEAGARLGISQSAVTQRARAAGALEGRRAAQLATELAGELLEGGR